MFNEAVEENGGYTRLYAGKKVMRILKHKFPKKSYTGRWYRLVPMAGFNRPEFSAGLLPLIPEGHNKYSSITLAELRENIQNWFHGQEKIPS